VVELVKAGDDLRVVGVFQNDGTNLHELRQRVLWNPFGQAIEAGFTLFHVRVREEAIKEIYKAYSKGNCAIQKIPYDLGIPVAMREGKETIVHCFAKTSEEAQKIALSEHASLHAHTS